MPIPNITRTNTIDEWRIQTNLSANALNSLETGNYTKDSGQLLVSNTGALVITSTGTPLQVAHNALVQGNVSIGKDISVGSSGTGIGNAQFGGVVTVYGPGNALLVSNSAIINAGLTVAQNITANTIQANTTINAGGDATIGGVLRLSNTGNVLYVNSGAVVINTATFSKTTTTNLSVTDVATVGTLNVSTIYSGVAQFSSAVINTDLNVKGNFTIVGNTLMDSNELLLRANSAQPIGSGYSQFGVRRTQTSGDTANNNAQIRWNEPNKYWDIRDIDNPTSYSKILTANLISDSVSSTSTNTLASSLAANTLSNTIQTANASMKVYVDNTVTTANTALKSYSDNKFMILNATGTQSVSNGVIFLKDVGVTGGITVSNTATFLKDVTVTGNITVQGTTTSISSVAISDSILALNADISPTTAPTENAGIKINRGSSANTLMRWNESLDYWDFTNDGTTYYKVPTSTTDLAEGTNLYLTSTRVRANISSTAPINYNSSTGVITHATTAVTATSYGDSITIPSFTVNETGHLTAASSATVRSSSTSQTGVVQLEDSVSSTSTTKAAVPNSVKTAYDHAQSAYAKAHTMGTMGTQNSSAVSITGGTITLGTLTNGTSLTIYNSAGGALKTIYGTTS